MATLQIVGVRAVVEGYRTFIFNINSMQSSVNQFGREAGFADQNLLRLGNVVQSLGRIATRAGLILSSSVTLPVTAIGFAALKTASDYESAFAGVLKTTRDTAGSLRELTVGEQALRDGFINLSKTIPLSAVELANIGEVAGQLGVRQGEIVGFTEVVANLAATTVLAAEDAATGLAKIAAIYGLTGEDLVDTTARLGSALVALGNNFATTEDDILIFARRIAGVGAVVGFGEEDILSLAAAFSSVGVASERGGTAVQKALFVIKGAVDAFDDGASGVIDNSGAIAQAQIKLEETTLRLEGAQDRLSRATTQSSFNNATIAANRYQREIEEINAELQILEATNGQTAEAIAGQLQVIADVSGTSAEEFAELWQKDAAKAFSLFIEGLTRNTDDAVGALDELQLADQRLIQAFITLSGASGLANEEIGLLTEALNLGRVEFQSNTALVEEASLRYETFASRLRILQSNVEAVFESIGQRLIPSIVDLIDNGLIPAVQFFGDLDESIQNFIIITAGIAAATGPTLVVLGVLASSFGSLYNAIIITNQVFGALLATGAIRGLLVGLGGLGIPVVAAAAGFLALRGSVQDFLSGLDPGQVDAFRGAVVSNLGAIPSLLADVFSGEFTRGGFARAFDSFFQSAFQEYDQASREVFNTGSIKDGIEELDIANNVLDALSQAEGFDQEFLISADDIALFDPEIVRAEAFSSDVQPLIDIIENILVAFNTVSLGVQTVLDSIITAFVSLKNTVVKEVVDLGETIAEEFGTISLAEFQAFVTGASETLASLIDRFTPIVRAITLIFFSVAEAGATVFGQIFTTARIFISSLIEEFSGTGQRIQDALGIDFSGDIVLGFFRAFQSIRSILENFTDFTGGVFENIQKLIPGAVSTISSAVLSIATVLGSAISSVRNIINAIKEIFSGFGQDVIDALGLSGSGTAFLAVFDFIGEVLTKVFSNITNQAITLFGFLEGFIPSAATVLRDAILGIATAIGNLLDRFSGGGGGASGTSQFSDTIANIITKLLAFRAIGSIVSSLFTKITSRLALIGVTGGSISAAFSRGNVALTKFGTSIAAFLGKIRGFLTSAKAIEFFRINLFRLSFVFGTLADSVTAAFQRLRPALSSIQAFAAALRSGFVTVIKTIFTGLVSSLNSLVLNIISIFSFLGNAILRIVTTAFLFIGKFIFESPRRATRQLVATIKRTISLISRFLLSSFPVLKDFGLILKNVFSLKNIVKLFTGGFAIIRTVILGVISLFGGPMTVVIAAVSALLLGLFALVADFDLGQFIENIRAGDYGAAFEQIKTSAKNVFDSIKELLNDTFGFLFEGAGGFQDGELFQSLKSGFESLLALDFTSALESFGDAFNIVKEAITPVLDNVKEFVDIVVDLFRPIIEDAAPLLREAFVGLGPLLEQIGGLFRRLLPIVGAGLVGAFGIFINIVRTVIDVFATLAPVVVSVVTRIIEIVNNIIDAVVAIGTIIFGLITGDSELVASAWEDLKTAGLNIFTNLVEGIGELLGGLWDAVRGGIETFVSGIIQFFTDLYDRIIGNSIIPDLVNDVVEFLKSLPEKAFIALQNLAPRAAQAFADATSATIAELTLFASRIVEKAREAIDSFIAKFNETDFKQIGIDLIARIIQGLVNFGSEMLTKATEGVASFTDFLKETDWEQVGIDVRDGIIKGLELLKDKILVPFADAVVEIGAWAIDPDNWREVGESIISSIVSFVLWTKDDLIPAFTSFISSIAQAIDLEQLKQVGLDFINGIQQGIAAGAEAIGDFLRGVVFGAKDDAKDAAEADSPSKLFAREVGKPLVDGIISGIEDNKKLFFESLINLIEEGLATITKLESFTLIGTELARQVDLGIIESGINIVETFDEDVLSPLLLLFEDSFTTIVQLFVTFGEEVTEVWTLTLEELLLLAELYIDGIVQTFESGMVLVRNAVVEGIVSAINAGRASIGQANSIGADLASGIASGISSNAGLIAGAFIDAINAAIAAAKAAAGIASPSEVTEDELGDPLREGIEEGLTDEEGWKKTGRRLVEIVEDLIDDFNEALFDRGGDLAEGFFFGRRDPRFAKSLENYFEVDLLEEQLARVIAVSRNTGNALVENIAEAFIEVAEEGDNFLDFLDFLISTTSNFLNIADSFASIWEENFIDPIKETIDILEDELSDLEDLVSEEFDSILESFEQVSGVDLADIFTEEDIQSLIDAVQEFNQIVDGGIIPEEIEELIGDPLTLFDPSAFDAARQDFLDFFEQTFGVTLDPDITDTELIRLAQDLQDAILSGETIDLTSLLSGIDELNLTQEELNQATQEYAELQERLAELEERRSQLNFLETQLELLQLINDLDLGADFLEGIELGLDANIDDLLSLMEDVIAELIEKAQEELLITSPSRVAANEIGKPFVEGITSGIFNSLGLISAAGLRAGQSLTQALDPALQQSVAFSNSWLGAIAGVADEASNLNSLINQTPFGGIGTFGTLQLNNPFAASSGQATSVDRSINVNVDANYTNSQSPASIQQDIYAALLSAGIN